jgi:tRNA(Glu) U13 pseudouridine synthase TruD
MIEQTEAGLRLTFSLDRGVYATTLLREFMKSC